MTKTHPLVEMAQAIPLDYRGPWGWYGSLKYDYYLATHHHGRLYVMGFERLGMRGAQPNFAHQREGEKYRVLRPAKDLAVLEASYRDDVAGIGNDLATWIAAASPNAVLDAVADARRDAANEVRKNLEAVWDSGEVITHSMLMAAVDAIEPKEAVGGE